MLTLIAAVVVASAAQPAAAPAIDPSRLSAARVLVKQLDVRGLVMRSMDRDVAAMKSGFAIRAMLAQQPGFVPAYQVNKAKFDPVLQKAGGIQAEIARKVINENIGTVVAEAERAYARNYSLAELQGLSKFYTTPLGQALYTRQPKVLAEIGGATTRIIGGKLDAAMRANAGRLQAALAPLDAAQPPKKK